MYFMETPWYEALFGFVVLILLMLGVGWLIRKWTLALLDRYRARTDLIRAQAEQTRKDALK